MRNRFSLSLLWAFSGALILMASSALAEPRECSAIHFDPVRGPQKGGVITRCVDPSDCREDVMARLIAEAACSKNAAVCAEGTETCSLRSRCVPRVNDEGIRVTKVTWDRDSECPDKGMHECTATWTIPAGAALSCGCGCAR